jgi:hypothetical protein
MSFRWWKEYSSLMMIEFASPMTALLDAAVRKAT